MRLFRLILEWILLIFIRLSLLFEITLLLWMLRLYLQMRDKQNPLVREKPELLVREKGICWLGVCLCGRGFGVWYEDGDYDETVDSADDLAEDPYSFLFAPAPHSASDFGKGTTITYARSSSMDSG